MHRLGRAGHQAGQHGGTGLAVGQIQEQGNKLITTQARQGVAFAQGVLHLQGQRHQQPVAHIMAVAVVDSLEPIEINKGHPHQLAMAQRLRHGLVQAVHQQRAVGQAGQRVVMRNVFELALMLLEVGDVRKQRHIVFNLALRVAHGADGLHAGIDLAIFTLVPYFTEPIAQLAQVTPHGDKKSIVLAR